MVTCRKAGGSCDVNSGFVLSERPFFDGGGAGVGGLRAGGGGG